MTDTGPHLIGIPSELFDRIKARADEEEKPYLELILGILEDRFPASCGDHSGTDHMTWIRNWGWSCDNCRALDPPPEWDLDD